MANNNTSSNTIIVEDEQQLFDWGIENRLEQYYETPPPQHVVPHFEANSMTEANNYAYESSNLTPIPAISSGLPNDLIRGNQTSLEPQLSTNKRVKGGRRPSLPTVDMDANELMKVERKRARNRVAASKCRLRKLERIAVLDRQAQQLRAENEQLQSLCDSLRSQLCRVKQELHFHLEQGCKIGGYETSSMEGSPDSSTHLEHVKTERNNDHS